MIGAALAVQRNPDQPDVIRAQRRLDRLADLTASGRALDLAMARLLAWLKQQDLSPLGYSTFSAFCRERVDWQGTWLRALVRFVTADLALIQGAVLDGLLPLGRAVRARAPMSDAEQLQWIEDNLTGRRKRDRSERIQLVGEPAARIHRARRRAQLLLGRRAPSRVTDPFILEAWRADTSTQELVDFAKRTPEPPPEPLMALTVPRDDRAASLVGPWTEPGSVQEATARLQDLQAARRRRVVSLGRCYRSFVDDLDHLTLGFDRLDDALDGHVFSSRRTLERCRDLADSLDRLPALQDALDDGMSVDRLTVVAHIANPSDCGRWLNVARCTGAAELRRAAHRARTESSAAILRDYERALERVSQLGGDSATDTVALRSAQQDHPPRPMLRVHPDLPTAAAWFLEQARLPPLKGFARIKQRDDYTCQNPECSRRNLRVEAHHITFRRTGGSDDPDNGICLCRPCHLRLVHRGPDAAGPVKVERIAEALRWTFPGRRVWVL